MAMRSLGSDTFIERFYAVRVESWRLVFDTTYEMKDADF
jgi:hypothetical protein